MSTRLLYTVGYGNVFFECGLMAMHTLRDVGYDGDAVLFSDRDYESEYCRVINVNTLEDRDNLKTDKIMSFHRKIGGLEDYEYDFFSIKYLPVSVIDKSQYDFILYVDSDILFKADPTEIFDEKCVITDAQGFSVWRTTKELRKYIDIKYDAIIRERGSWGGAAIGVPKEMYSFYDKYRDCYLKHLHEIPHDQPALNLCLFNNKDEYKPKALENKKYWLHYWGAQKKEMAEDYKKRFYK